MKKFALALAAASMVVAATPALAEHKRQDTEQHHKKNGGKWIVPLLGGIIVGAIIAGSDRQNSDVEYRGERQYDPYYSRDRYYDRPRVEYYDSYEYRQRYGDYTHYCVTSQHVDRWGNVYYTRQCQ